MIKLFFKLPLSVLIIVLLMTAFMNQHASAFGHDYSIPPMFISCHHEADGVIDPSPYAMVIPPQSCPPWETSPQAEHVDAAIDAAKTAAGLPPHLCRDVELPEW